MAVKAKDVKALRDKTGAGMMDCKKALGEAGDMEAAIDWLRKKGLSKASKKSGRVAAEGKVLALTSGTRGILVELNSETDFAAKNEKFISFADSLAKLALDEWPADLDAMRALDYPGTGRNVADELNHAIATIGENMNLSRIEKQEVGQGAVASYIHMGGKIGVLVTLESDVADSAALADVGKKVAMHVAAASPAYLDRSGVPTDVLDREKNVLSEQARASGKPENIVEKIVMGRVNKFYGEICLLDQAFVVDPDLKVSQFVAQSAKSLGGSIKVTGYSRMARGEGVEKKQEDFAAEVSKQMG